VGRVYDSRLVVISLQKMNPDALIAEGNEGHYIGLYRAAIVVINLAKFFVLGMMGVSTKDNIGASFLGVLRGALSDSVNRSCVVFAIVS